MTWKQQPTKLFVIYVEDRMRSNLNTQTSQERRNGEVPGSTLREKEEIQSSHTKINKRAGKMRVEDINTNDLLSD